jgi:hypothetical protein
MYKVYWTENDTLAAKEFGNDEMSAALQFSQELRNQQYKGEKQISFIVMAVENPDMVGKQGVDVTGPDYDWKKRRI